MSIRTLPFTIHSNVSPSTDVFDSGYESSPVAGDAACSFAGIVYSPNGTFPIPGYNSSTTAVAPPTPTADISSSNPSTVIAPITPTVPPYPTPRSSVNVGATGTGSGPIGTGGAGDPPAVGTGGFQIPTYTAVPVTNGGTMVGINNVVALIVVVALVSAA